MKKILLIIPILLFVAAGCNFRAKAPEPNTVDQNQEQAEEPDENLPGGMAEFKKTYKTGFEENVFSLTYSLQYPQGRFSVSNDGTNTSKIFIKDNKTDKTHSIQIFNNDGAGFASVTEFWTAMKYCADCKKVVKNDLNLKGAIGLQVYENSSEVWYVYAHDPGFVAIKIVKPIDDVKAVIESFELSTSLIE
jgi:hypothetical protein